LINVMGNRTGHNLFLVDGVNVTDEYFNNVVLSPSVDAVSEFNIAKQITMRNSAENPAA